MILGIDPGKGGGLAMLGVDARAGAWKMPDTLADLDELIRAMRGETGNVFCYIEKVRSSPQMGVTSSFTFGRGLGRLEALLTAHRIPYEEIAPGKWQHSLGCLTKGDKNVTKAKAQQLFPGVKVTHYVADALLIAEYGRRVRSQTPTEQPT